jgi:hypothetical protein
MILNSVSAQAPNPVTKGNCVTELLLVVPALIAYTSMVVCVAANQVAGL